MPNETNKLEQVQQALEKAIQETVQKDGLEVPKYTIEVMEGPAGAVDYVIEYTFKNGQPAGLGFRNIRPVNPEDFDDPKFKVRLLHNLSLWLKAQALRDK